MLLGKGNKGKAVQVGVHRDSKLVPPAGLHRAEATLMGDSAWIVVSVSPTTDHLRSAVPGLRRNVGTEAEV